MSYKNGNYSAFYVKEPFNESNLGAHATHDFCYYQMLRAWKGKVSSFPFNDSHDKTYNVRDGSDWEKTLKPRLHERLRNSKNIILFLSSNTQNSKALKEELEYGAQSLFLPIIIIYPDFKTKESLLDVSLKNFNTGIKTLWKNVTYSIASPSVPILHIPFDKGIICNALQNTDFMLSKKKEAGNNYYP